MARPLTRKPSGPIGELTAVVMKKTGLRTFADFARHAGVLPSMVSKYWGSTVAPEDDTLHRWLKPDPVTKKANPLAPFVNDFKVARRALDELRRTSRAERREPRAAVTPDWVAALRVAFAGRKDLDAMIRFLENLHESPWQSFNTMVCGFALGLEELSEERRAREAERIAKAIEEHDAKRRKAE